MVNEKNHLADFSFSILGGAIFDFDGTLVESMRVWRTLGATYLKRCGYEPEVDLEKKLYDMTIHEVAEYFKGRYQIAVSREQIISECYGIIEDAYKYTIELKPYAREFLSLLQQNSIPMYLATATDRHLVMPALERLNLLPFFKGVITSPEVGDGKSDSPKIYDFARKELGVPLEKAVVFEDAHHAVEMAQRGGYRVAALYDSCAFCWDTIQTTAHWAAFSLKEYYDALQGTK